MPKRVPEIGEDLPETNPLLRGDGLPEFNNITIEKCVATIGKQAIDVEKTVQRFEEINSKNPDLKANLFDDLLRPLEQIEAQLETTWGLAKCLYLGNSTLMPTKSYLLINDRARKARYSKFSSLPIFKVISESKLTFESNEEKVRLLNKYLLEGKLNGVGLNDKKKAILNETMDKLKKERSKYKTKVEYSIRNFSHTISDYNSVREFPFELLQNMSSDPLNPNKGPWKVTLQSNVYNGFMEQCQNRNLRWNIWQGNTRKASGYADTKQSNSIHIEEIRDLRKTQANILGYESYIDMSMETKMAGNVSAVRAMLSNLLEYGRPAQEQEIKMLQQFANKSGQSEKLELYDVPFWKRKHIKSVFNYDEDAIREFFPLPKVLTGLFELSEKLFQIKIVERAGVTTWHEDVRFFDVFDVTDNSNKPLAGFYLDLYSREDDKIRVQGSSGLMVGIRNRCHVSDNCPLAALIFNFSSPLYGKPSLLTFNDVNTLFIKFGHSLQHLLTKVNHSELAGLSNVEWDAVEVSGHVLSHLLYHENNIKNISGHFVSEEQLSDDLVIAIKEQRKHLAGFRLCSELYIASLDLELHSKKDFWLDIVKSLWNDYYVFPLDKKDAHPCSLTDIFSGDWGGAYFSHIWSRVIAADVYSAFYEVKDQPDMVEEVGRRFRDTYLALGGSSHSSDVFRRFRGRDPSAKPLLKTLGLNKSIVDKETK